MGAMMSMSEFRTSDMGLCAFLKNKGFVHLKVEKVSDNRSEMVFENEDKLRKAVFDFQNGEARVEPREFQRNIGLIRTVLLDAVRPSD